MLILQWNITILIFCFCFYLVICVFLFNYYYYYFTAIFITKLQKCVGLQTSKDFKSQNLNPKNHNEFFPVKSCNPNIFSNTPTLEYFNQFIAKIWLYYSQYFASDFEIALSLSVDLSLSYTLADVHHWFTRGFTGDQTCQQISWE